MESFNYKRSYRQGEKKMKMIKAIIRPEKAEKVEDSLAEQGYVSLTKWDILGRGKQMGLNVDGVH